MRGGIPCRRLWLGCRPGGGRASHRTKVWHRQDGQAAHAPGSGSAPHKTGTASGRVDQVCDRAPVSAGSGSACRTGGRPPGQKATINKRLERADRVALNDFD